MNLLILKLAIEWLRFDNFRPRFFFLTFGSKSGCEKIIVAPVFLRVTEYRNDGETLRRRKSPVEYEIIINLKRESKYEGATEK
jgi:hypothetical protein